ncbi:MAG: hypothetical protein KDG49_21610 [Geminicoccaceae bacterium]|nr:hypothetical protein [Geminicoccaceae bacterium]
MACIRARFAAPGLAALLCAAGPVAPRAADALVSEGWQVQLTPYFWALAMEGNTRVRGIKGEPDVSFEDIWDNLDYAVMLEGEVRKGRFGMFANVIYADLGDTQNVDGFDVKGEATVSWAGFGGFYRLGPWTVLPEAGTLAPKVVVDPYAGVRYTYADVTLDVRNGGPQGSDDQDWVDPIVGVRTIWQIGSKWSVTALGDIGGFGVGSQFSWQVFGGYTHSWDIGRQTQLALALGYRILSVNYEQGSGTNQQALDLTLHGPLAGLSVRW